jgi:hypothetical protein
VPDCVVWSGCVVNSSIISDKHGLWGDPFTTSWLYWRDTILWHRLVCIPVLYDRMGALSEKALVDVDIQRNNMYEIFMRRTSYLTSILYGNGCLFSLLAILSLHQLRGLKRCLSVPSILANHVSSNLVIRSCLHGSLHRHTCRYTCHDEYGLFTACGVPSKQALVHNTAIQVTPHAASKALWILPVNKARMISLQHFVYDLELIETH